MPTQTDPICGMSVEETAAIQTQYKDTIYYFCSEDCHKKFDELVRETSEAFKGLKSDSSLADPDQKTREVRKDWEIS